MRRCARGRCEVTGYWGIGRAGVLRTGDAVVSFPKHRKLSEVLDGRPQEEIDRLWQQLDGGGERP